MEKLVQIIRSFDNHKLRHIDVLNNQDSKSRDTQLYQQIQKGKVNNDDEAAQFLFGKDANSNTGKYRAFKAPFKKKVMNTLLFIDTTDKDNNEYQHVVYEINREWMAIKALYSRGLTALATKLAEQLLPTVLKYEYAEVGVLLLSSIKYGFAAKGDKEQYVKYQNLFNEYVQIWLADQKADEYNNLLKMEYVKTVSYKPHLSKVAQTYFEELKPLMDKYSSINLHLYGRCVEIYIYSTLNDYKGILDVAERALSFLKSRPFTVNLGVSVFLHQKTIALMMLKRYSEADEAIIETMKNREYASFNWFKAQESRVALLFRMRRYTEGYEILNKVIEMPEFRQILTGMSQEIWVLYDAYFKLLYKLGVATDLPFSEKDVDFKIQKFLNEVPTFNLDKRGMHLSTLIIEICFMLSLKQRDLLIDRIEAIQKYLNRNTDKTDPSYRFNIFGRMLLEIPKSGFKRSILESNTAQLLKNLQSNSYNTVESIYRSEVVELEELWELVLSNYEKLK
jgi:hypothetical protein